MPEIGQKLFVTRHVVKDGKIERVTLAGYFQQDPSMVFVKEFDEPPYQLGHDAFADEAAARADAEKRIADEILRLENRIQRVSKLEITVHG